MARGWAKSVIRGQMAIATAVVIASSLAPSISRAGANACFDLFARKTNPAILLKASPQWQIPPDLQVRINRSLFFENLVLSRTASKGQSSKALALQDGASSSVADLKRVASENGARAFEMINKLASSPEDLSGEAIFKFFGDVNSQFNEGILSTTSSGVPGKAGEYRSYGYLPGDKGLQGEALAEHLKGRLQEVARWLATELRNKNADPIRLASEAHQRITLDIKPFHDGNGRTGRAAIDLVFMRLGYPLPRYTTDSFQATMDLYFKAGMADVDGFASYLRGAVERTNVSFAKVGQVDLDISNPVTIAISLNRLGVKAHRFGKVRLPNGNVITLGSFLGQGRSGAVYCMSPSCATVIKLPLSVRAALELPSEVERHTEQKQLGIPVAEIVEVGPTYLIKNRVVGERAIELVEQNRLTEAQLTDLAKLAHLVLKNNYLADLNPYNLIWETASGRFINIDTGVYEDNVEWFKSVKFWHYYYFQNNRPGFESFLQTINKLRKQEGMGELAVNLSEYKFK